MAGSVLRLGVVVDVAMDGPAVAAVKSLGPPTVQNRKLQAVPGQDFIPPVPLASLGGRERLTHTSQPATNCAASVMS